MLVSLVLRVQRFPNRRNEPIVWNPKCWTDWKGCYKELLQNAELFQEQFIIWNGLGVWMLHVDTDIPENNCQIGYDSGSSFQLKIQRAR